MPTAVSLFSGAGGFCEGVRLAGFKVMCAVEMDGYAIRTHSVNFPKVPMFRGDVTRFLVDAQPGVPSKRELIDGGVDLVYGGPPCQGFSQIGPRDLKDPRNLLYLEFARVLKALKPKAFIMENVPNMVAMKNGHFRDLIFSALKGAGYHNTVLVPLTASEYGVPQHRRRVFFVGTRDDLASPSDLAVRFDRHLVPHRSEREITVREAISDLPRRVAPLNRGSLNSTHIRGTLVPVEEPSTASTTEVAHSKEKTARRRLQFKPNDRGSGGQQCWL
jgi:DNA (cytosine-5)-methyltransferase 1